MAVAFTVYSALLLGYSVSAWRQMKDDAGNFLVADSKRRAAALSDLVVGLRESAHEYADAFEIRSYLMNRDLGMSPKYGLNYSLQMIGERFSRRAIDDASRWGTSPHRVAYLTADGALLVDSQPQAGALPKALPIPAGEAVELKIFPEGRFLVAVSRVSFNSRFEGMVVVVAPIDTLYRNLLASESTTGGYRELLITMDGVSLPGPDGSAPLARESAQAIARASENSVLTMSSLVELGAEAARIRVGDPLVVATAVAGVPLKLITLVSSERAYGHIASSGVLLLAGVVPLILLMGAFRLDKLRRKTERLQLAVAESERDRLRAEIRNEELAEEIVRRNVVERALADSEQRWHLAIAGTNDGVWDWNIASGETFFSERWKSIIGNVEGALQSREEAWSSRIHDEDRGRVLDEMRRHLRRESEFYQCEYRLRHRDGGYVWTLDRGRALFDDAGRPVRMAGSLTDITARRAAQSALKERNEQLGAIFELSADGFVTFGPDYRMRYISPASWKVTGLPEREAAQFHIDDFLRELAGQCVSGVDSAAIETLFSGRDPASHAARTARVALGAPANTFVEVTLRAGGGEAVSAVLYLRDITWESEVERMKSEFLSTAAHELRTPMASIFGYSELLLAREFDVPTRREFLEIMFRNSERIISIINELLDLARIEARRGKDFSLETADMNALLREELADFKEPQGRDPPVLRASDSPCMVRVDRAKMLQAISNVLSNAYKYSPDGGDVGVELVGDGAQAHVAGRVGVRVKDSGIGMTPEQIERVFERFYRADTSGKIPGTGLGMSIVKEIIELHGGSVDLESEIGAGTTVTIWVPTLAAQAVSAAPASGPVT